MRILMAGDTHGDIPHVRYLIKTALAEKCDRIFVLGDFGYWEHTAEGRNFLDRVELNANLKNVPIYFLDGNHDKTSLLLEKYDNLADTNPEGFLGVRNYIYYARRGLQWRWGGVDFIALGGAYSVDKEWRVEQEIKRGKPESLWFPEEEMTDKEMDAILAVPFSTDVILAHDKPRSARVGWDRKDFPECMPNQDRLQKAVDALKPTAYFHGHFHYRYTDVIRSGTAYEGCTVEGLNCNTSAQEQARPLGTDSWMVFDTDEFFAESNDRAEALLNWIFPDDEGETVEITGPPLEEAA